MPVISITKIADWNIPLHDPQMGKKETPEERQRRQEPIIARIRQVIDEKHIQQTAIAEAIGTTPVTVWKYLNGQVGIDKKLVKIARVLGVSAEWLEHGGEMQPDVHTAEIEAFIAEVGPTLRPPLSSDEARWARAYPYHRVTRGKLLDMVLQQRRGLSHEEAAASAEVTEAARAAGEALGVPRRRP